MHDIHVVFLHVTHRRWDLGAELLRGQLEGAGDLFGEDFRITEAKRVQRDLSDHGVVWDHHGDGTEQSLQDIM